MPIGIGATSERRLRIAMWVADTVMPHEANVRAWLVRARVPQEDIDDLIQESYCSLAGLDTVDHIDRPDAYFFSTVRNLLSRKLRRAAVVPIATIAEIESFDDDRPSPEREVAGRRDYDRVRALIATLPEPSRQVVQMRRLEGRPQREIAAELGISEGMVEWHVHKGVQSVLKRMRGDDEGPVTVGRSLSAPAKGTRT
jgi:RNA polymerase sigma factor (sigma-70 family)